MYDIAKLPRVAQQILVRRRTITELHDRYTAGHRRIHDVDETPAAQSCAISDQNERGLADAAVAAFARAESSLRLPAPLTHRRRYARTTCGTPSTGLLAEA